MIKDIFFSFRENLRQKTTNPFFGTLIIVWIIHNWKLLFTFFNFEKDETLDGKLMFLSKYFDAKPFLLNLGSCIMTTFAVLIITYLLLDLSRLIVNLFDKKITPWVYKITDKSSIVLKSTYQILEKERDNLSQKLENEREKKLSLQNEVSILEERIKELNAKEDKKNPIEQFLNEPDTEKSKIELLINDIDHKDLSVPFDNIINKVNNEDYINFDTFEIATNYLLKAGIIKLKDKKPGETKFRHYQFTNFGEKVKDEFVMRNLKK